MLLLFPFCVLLADAGQLVTLRFFLRKFFANKTAMEVAPGSNVQEHKIYKLGNLGGNKDRSTSCRCSSGPGSIQRKTTAQTNILYAFSFGFCSVFFVSDFHSKWDMLRSCCW